MIELFERIKDFLKQDWWCSTIDEACEECDEDPCSCEPEGEENG
jgi:hypothetical protein